MDNSDSETDVPGIVSERQTDSPVKIKEEPPDDIKDYAENTMNELLGWYGYDKVNSADTEHLNLERYTSIDDVCSPTDGGSRDDDSILSDDDEDSLSGRSDFSRLSRSNSESSLAAQHRNLVSALTKKHGLTGAPDGTLPSGYITCAWCQKPGIKLFTLKTSTTTKAFCSEVCFTQCRRASFKKNRVCDWCKHVRHTVNYVDFQDGEQQLQFCSAKCLNQYKMKIFCKETQEHLQQIQTPNDNVSSSKSPDRQILITPDLWMKDSSLTEEKSENKSTETASDRDNHKESYNNRGSHKESHREGHSHKEKVAHRDSHREEREKTRKHSSKSEWKSDLHKSHSHSEIDRSRSVMDRLVRERHRRSSSKDSAGLASPQLASSDPSPTATSSAQPNPMFANAAGYPSMPIIPPHLWGAFGPGMPPMGPIPPWFYGGYMPPIPGVIPGGQIPNTDGVLRPPNSRMSTPTPNRPALSPDSSSPSATPNTNLTAAKQSSTSATVGGTKCSQKVPVPGVTSLLTGMANTGHTPSVLGFDPSLVGAGYRHGSQYLGGMPPVTMIMPVPFPLPVPFPVPLPLPLKMEQIMEVYNKKQEQKKTEMKHESVSQRKQIDKHVGEPERNHRIKVELSDSSDSEIVKKHDKTSLHCVSYSERASSVTSCPDLSDIHSSAHDLSTRKRPLTPRLDGSLDLSKRPRSEANASPDSYDGVIDLSMDSSMIRYKMSPGKENRETNESDISQDGEERDISNGELGLKIPRIHIITPRSEPPLNQQLPLPPAEHKYSNRRGLILDAPCTPNRPRSPSPERRNYVRSVPRDVMEAARRRCLRARIRTK
ncbi:sine oculis-binding protein homolog [Ylistrum balloti]|uniref:sine oculis-binding protein homolog n=1 Tax=Ylistrum balloti TaxID=509963 RepID=UPI002905A5F3|nr:sine oculis-binding protein homolog [Ylistrum balloti]